MTILGVCLRVRRQHSQFWPILTRFVDYYSLLWGPKAISMVVEPQGAVTCRPSIITVLADFGPFHGQLLTDFGSHSDFHDLRTSGCVYVSFINIPRFVQFRVLSCTITQCFGDPEGFPRLNPGVHLCVCRQHSQFWPILTCFVGYYSRFWGPEAISIVVEPQGPLTCPSSTLTVFADSGPFCGLLLTVFGSRSDFHD